MSLDRFESELRSAAPKDAPSADRRAVNRASVMAAAGLAVPPPPAAALATKGALIVKLSIVVLAVGAMVAVVLATRSSPPAPSVPTTMASAVVAAPEPEPPTVESAPPAVASAPPAFASAPPHPPAPSASAPDPLSVEAALLESARACLNGQDSGCAATKLAEYDRRFPHGALADEATLLHIDAARARGDRAEARRYAERLLAAHPSGTYAKRAKAILADLAD